jgi:RNA polymerase sigma-70 factor (sigma-E family)
VAAKDPLEEEFREFVAARSGALLRTAYLLTGDWATAEDLLQTALTKTYLACKRLGGIEAIEPYARRVMVNTSTSWWRRRWHGERPTEVLPERAGVDEIEQQLDRDVLWRQLRALPSRQRAVLVLRFYEDMSEAQTAALLEISPGTVKSQTSRALATLRRRLGAQAALDLTDAAAEPQPAGRAGNRPDPRTRPAAARSRPARQADPAARPAPAAPPRAAPAAVPAVPRPTRAGAPAEPAPAGPGHRPAPAGGAPLPVAGEAVVAPLGVPAEAVGAERR